MSVETSQYQLLKLQLAEYVPVDRDILHVLIGLALLGIAAFLTRQDLRLRPFVIALAVAAALGLLMESLDGRDDIAAFGHWRWRAGVLDFIRTTAFPAMGVLSVLRLRWMRSRHS